MKIRIILAEDHQSLLDAFTESFKNDDQIEVVGASTDPHEILELIVSKNPAVLLSDLSMPKMNGVDLCKRAKSLDKSLRVVFFSMYEDDQAVKDVIDAGCDGYIFKSNSFDEVRKAILEVSNGKRYFDAGIDLQRIKEIEKSTAKPRLSKSEREILKLIAQGKSSSEIADFRFTAVSTVQKHRKNILRKLNLTGKGELLRYALTKYGHYGQPKD